MLGGLIGDYLGSCFEGYQSHEKMSLFFENHNQLLQAKKHRVQSLLKNVKWVREEQHWTDDTLCTLGLLKAYIEGKDYAKTLQDICVKYQKESVGFGKGFEAWLKNPQPYQSFANGAVMRIGFIPHLPILYKDKQKLAYEMTMISHDHADSLLAVEIFIQLCERLKRTGDIKEINHILNDFQYFYSLEDLRSKKIFEMNALKTLLQALVIIKNSRSIDEVYANCLYVGGDVDTLACIAGNIAEFLFVIPENMKNKTLNCLYQYDDLSHIYSQFMKIKVL